MTHGKQTCKVLKEIRRQIAEANQIDFISYECLHKGDCLGTCPKCESEIKYLEQNLRARQLSGKAVLLAGISVGVVTMLSSFAAHSQPLSAPPPCDDTPVCQTADTFLIKGIVLGTHKNRKGKFVTDTLIGASVLNISAKKYTHTNIDGEFELEVSKGDSIEVQYIGFNTQTIVITNQDLLKIILNDKGVVLQGMI